MRRSSGPILLLPAVTVFTLLVGVPLGFIARVSLLPHGPAAPLTGAWSLSSYTALGDAYILGILLRTVRVSALTTAGCLLLGYPLALSIRRARGAWRTLQTGLVISPLMVSVVVRAFGWTLLLGRRGLVNNLAIGLGLVREPLPLLQTEPAVVVGLVEALLPFMVLSIAASLDHVDRALVDAARGLGDSSFGAFRRITLPLSMPGVVAGCLLVFMVAMSSYATPVMLGGARVRLMVSEIYTQVTSVFDWPLAASLSMLLLATALAAAAAATRLRQAS